MMITPIFSKLPSMVCFRVTRFCNARCSFCLAPPDGGKHPAAALLQKRINWLMQNGVKTIHFCGGEPTIHHDLSKLINQVTMLGGKSKMTTNGILLPDDLVTVLRKAATDVKVSLHGNATQHNRITGKSSFDKTTSTIVRLVKEKITTTVQTTIVSGHLDVVEWMVRFCLDNGVTKLRLLPFIPRGYGAERNTEFALSEKEKIVLHTLIMRLRKTVGKRLDIKLIDFNTSTVPVVEPDGNIILEGAMEGLDKIIGNIDAQELPLKNIPSMV
jgi:MoaA/NifB/PqqE/SkfB family radical SAM enzyme